MVFGSTGFCGLYYMTKTEVQPERCFLPQVQLAAHASIIQSTSRVTLTQTFVNPSALKGIREVKYVFPLYEGVSVVGFTCHVDGRIIVGEVKEKHEAKQDYTKAISQGETAGLFEQLSTSDTFMTTVGNIPPGARVKINITYLGELKHDMEVNGIRFTIPSIITPRYGRTAPGYDAALNHYASTLQTSDSSISITVDAEMTKGSFIEKILSPSHPISVSLGTTSIAPHEEPTMSKASATLSLGSARLENDFVLQIVAKDTGVPKAILENHPTIPNQRALMATLVPNFVLPSEKPEVVFICDRSGSMDGGRMVLVKEALQLFLKSLPVGVMFNICSFGSRFSFLWPRSKPYNQETLDEATNHVTNFNANFGGTEMLAPLKATILQRYQDIPLEVMLVTDGDIWDQDDMFVYLNEQIQNTKAPIRVFSLGVGSGVSHSLIEGVARAGNGFSQSVAENERLDTKVVRMLKGALSPHVTDYTLEVKYSGSMDNTEEDDDFEIVEKVADSLKVKLDLGEKEDKPEPTKPISLFDPTANPDKTDFTESTKVGASRYAHLPSVSIPNIIQAPQKVPPLFAFVRSTVYLLLGPDAPRQTPKSVVLRGTSTHGPLELEFPVQVLDKPGETIHQLAVKKATYELEQERGWLPEAKDDSGKLLKEWYESRFSNMVEREAVRLGVQFQVSGKWCSFVAVERNNDAKENKQEQDWGYIEDEVVPPSSVPIGSNPGPIDVAASPMSPFGRYKAMRSQIRFQSFARMGGFAPRIAGAPRLGGAPRRGATLPLADGDASGLSTNETVQSGGNSGAANMSRTASRGLFVAEPQPHFCFASMSSQPPASPTPNTTAPKTDDDILALLVKLQKFEGSWEYNTDFFLAIGITQSEADYYLGMHSVSGSDTMQYEEMDLATALAISYLQINLPKLQGAWELVAEKAKGWLEEKIGSDDANQLLSWAKTVLNKS